MSERPPVRSKENALVFGSPATEQAKIDAVVSCLKSRWISPGPHTAIFERDFAASKGVPAAAALGLKPGDEVSPPPLTFCATVNAILHAGKTPVLADIGPVTLNTAADGAALRPRLLPEMHPKKSNGSPGRRSCVPSPRNWFRTTGIGSWHVDAGLCFPL